jgi:predicted dehydrogenase
MTSAARIAILGAGNIGKIHAAHAAREAQLCAFVDPAPQGAEVARAYNVPHYPTLSDLFAAGRPDGVVVATPNQLHVAHGLECVAAGVAALIEKPLADDVAQGVLLVQAAQQADVPLLVGHHRRYNPMIASAKAAIESGRLGRIVALNAMCWLYKPDAYFDVKWRTQPGAGPVLINLIHDIDLMRHLCGEISTVQAISANHARGHAVEDTAVVLLGFANGALGTMSVSDSIAAPWSWELTAGENAAYPRSGAACYTIGGTSGALSLPDLGLWSYSDAPSWMTPIAREAMMNGQGDPLAIQMRHFADVSLRRAAPLVSGDEGLATLRVLMAIKRAAETGQPVTLSSQA